MTYLYLICSQGGRYLFTGRIGELVVSTPDALSPTAALDYARLLHPVLGDTEVLTSNVPAGDPVLAALLGKRR